MYKILDLKRVFSTFQETVWSLLKMQNCFQHSNKFHMENLEQFDSKCLTVFDLTVYVIVQVHLITYFSTS